MHGQVRDVVAVEEDAAEPKSVVAADAFTAAARTKIESAGGILSPAILGSFALLAVFPFIAKRLLAWIDEEAAIYAIVQLGTSRVVTKFMSEINFVSSARQGDIIELGITASAFGRTSISLCVEIRNKITRERILTIDRIVLVSVDADFKPVPHGRTRITYIEDRFREQAGDFAGDIRMAGKPGNIVEPYREVLIRNPGFACMVEDNLQPGVPGRQLTHDRHKVSPRVPIEHEASLRHGLQDRRERVVQDPDEQGCDQRQSCGRADGHRRSPIVRSITNDPVAARQPT